MTYSDQSTERRRMRSYGGGLITKLGAAALAVGALSLFGAPVAMAQPSTETAPAVITNPSLSPINSGGSTTPFSIVLPANSHCSGDTHTDGYLVYSYITQADPSTLTFSVANASGGPSSGYSEWETLNEGQNAYAAIATSITTGNIPQTPDLDYTLFSTTGTGGSTFVLAPGTYNVGIACATRSGALDQFWNVQESFVANAGDPSGESWSVVPATSVPESPLTVALPIGAILVLGAGVVVVYRRRRSRGPVAA